MTIHLKSFLVISALLAFTVLSSAQSEFTVKDGSENYSAIISVSKFVNNDCSGPGTVTLYDKSTGNLFQSFKSDNLCFYLDGKSTPSVNVIELYGEQSPLIFEDFNFDGYEDLAISNGNNGSYSSPSFDVYLYSPSSEKFVRNSALTEIASVNLGMFNTDRNKKKLVTYNKSGCCWHITTEYEFRKNNLVKTYELEEDATGGIEYITVTERILVNNSWKSEARKYKIEDYYKDK
ncbi:MAG: hypothetical protein WCK13_08285 [Ignavibacteriota bacterium]